MNVTANDIPLIVWVAIGILLFAQGMWLFVDARKRNRNEWFWGIWGLTSVPGPLVIYLVATRLVPKLRCGRGEK